MQPKFDPVTVDDLIQDNAELSAHCRACGHWKVTAAADLPARIRARAVPSLEGVFRCTWCQSRNTTAMPYYRQQKRPSR